MSKFSSFEPLIQDNYNYLNNCILTMKEELAKDKI